MLSSISSPSRRGDVAEHIAAAYLMEQGYEVFHNASSVGPVDLLATDADGDIYKYDVKRSHLMKGAVYVNGAGVLTDKQKELGVKLLHVFIGPEFQVVVSDNEELFFASVTALGFAVRDLKKKRVSATSYKIKTPDGSLVDIVGIVKASGHIGISPQEFSHKLLKGKEINGFSFISKEKTTILIDR